LGNHKIRKKNELEKINIQNTHSKLRVKKKPIQLLVESVLIGERTDSSVDVIFVDDEFMRRLNKEFAKKDKTTDVLSFPMSGGGPDGVEYPSLGDIYVSLDQAKRQAADYNAGFDEEVALLVAHGLLHLLGYDHQDRNQENIMRKKEETYLKKAEKLFQDS
jgi:probable rRNA maturation factor